jgi:alkylhydroperoxidase family enzyme
MPLLPPAGHVAFRTSTSLERALAEPLDEPRPPRTLTVENRARAEKGTAMRLEPIERPRGLMMRFASWMMRRKFGKVITPFKVVQTRVPKSMRAFYEISKMMEHGFSLDMELQFLLHTHISEVNQCGFCIDIAQAMVVSAGGSLDKIKKLPHYRDDPAFTPAERAALAYVEEVSKTKTASDATFAELRRHFSDQQIVEITLLNAGENFYNLVNRPLGIESDGLCALATKKGTVRELQTAHG